MSVTPLVPQLPPHSTTVAPTGAAISTGAGDAAAAGFAALVAGLLAGHTPTPVPVLTVVATTGEDLPGEVAAEEQPGEAAPASELLALPGLAALVVPVTVPTATMDPGTGPAVEPDVAAAAVRDTGPAVALPADQHVGRADDAATAIPHTDVPAPSTAPTAAPATTLPAATSAVAQVAPSTPMTPATPAGPTTAAPPPVTAQVIPEVTRLVSQGNGTHRLTMTLRPEALGEVRVTLTVRDGEVQVRFAAGDEAQRALAEGAPELRRVLELAGATDPRVVVRDLAPPATQTTQVTQAPHLHLGDTAAGGEGRGDTAAAGQDRSGPQDQHARTRAGTTATDGLSDGVPAARPEPVGHARSSGVDLTM